MTMRKGYIRIELTACQARNAAWQVARIRKALPRKGAILYQLIRVLVKASHHERKYLELKRELAIAAYMAFDGFLILSNISSRNVIGMMAYVPSEFFSKCREAANKANKRRPRLSRKHARVCIAENENNERWIRRLKKREGRDAALEQHLKAGGCLLTYPPP